MHLALYSMIMQAQRGFLQDGSLSCTVAPLLKVRSTAEAYLHVLSDQPQLVVLEACSKVLHDVGIQ